MVMVRVEATGPFVPGVTVTGGVPAVAPYLNRAEVAVVPLRIGRGVQNKLLEAMAAGLPAVATTVARTGVAAMLPEIDPRAGACGRAPGRQTGARLLPLQTRQS